jgi:hypothetical protein
MSPSREELTFIEKHGREPSLSELLFGAVDECHGMDDEAA